MCVLGTRHHHHTCCGVWLTLLAVVALVGGHADADALHALAVVGAGGVHALVLLDAALGALPAGVACATALLVLAVTAAQHRARVCGHAVKRGVGGGEGGGVEKGRGG